MCLFPVSGIVRDALFLSLEQSISTSSSSSLSLLSNVDAAATTVAALPLDVVVLLLLSDVKDEFILISSNSLPNNSFSVSEQKSLVSPNGLNSVLLLLFVKEAKCSPFDVNAVDDDVKAIDEDVNTEDDVNAVDEDVNDVEDATPRDCAEGYSVAAIEAGAGGGGGRGC